MNRPSADDAPTGSHAAAHRRPFPWRLVAVVAVLAAAVAGGLGLGRALGDRSTEHRYVIPAGTGARLDAGERVEIVPASLTFARGDTLTVTNDDDRVHQIGVFGVRPGETLSYRFPNPGVFQGACSVHTSGMLTITIV